MRLVYIDLNDHELFMSNVDSNLYNFFLDHMDTFRQMWDEQGKSFWVRFLIAFRDYVYDKGQGDTFIHEAGLNNSIHDLALISDAIFLNIHRHFIEGKTMGARDFMEDIVCLTQNRHLLVHIGKKSIVNNPLYIKDVRDSFRKLFLYPQFFKLSSQDVTIFQIGFAAPIYVKFCGAVTVLLKRWITCKNCPAQSLPVYWPKPSHWKTGDSQLLPFQLYLRHIWGVQVDEITGVDQLYKTLTEKIDSLKSKSKTGDSANGKKNDMQEKYGVDADIFNTDEMKERKLFLMAEKQFADEAKVCTEKTKTKKKKRNKNAIRNAIEMASKDATKPKKVPKAASTTKETQTSCSECKFEKKIEMTSLESELKEIGENIDIIQNTVKEEGGLDFESFLLMLKTGELLMRNNHSTKDSEDQAESKKVILHNCSHCEKKEVTPKTFKKCSRCKVENIDKPRYYCSRDCQVEDWEECHRKEHSLLQKK